MIADKAFMGKPPAAEEKDMHLHHPLFISWGKGVGKGRGLGDGKGEKGRSYENVSSKDPTEPALPLRYPLAMSIPERLLGNI